MRAMVGVGALLLCSVAGEARAEEPGGESAVVAVRPAPRRALTDPKDEARLRRLEADPGFYARLFGSLSFGKGLRFNNPYRLGTVLGDSAASISLSAAYLDAALSLGFGDPEGVFHGPSLHVGGSLEGVLQPYLTPSYVIGYRADLPVMFYGRVGPAIVLAPDVNVGGELAASASYFFSAGIGVTSELVFDLFYGAATLDKSASATPLLSLQLGVIVDYEFLP